MIPRLLRIVLLLVLALVLIGTLLPIGTIAFLRTEYSWLGGSAEQIERAIPWLDMDHLVAFALLGLSCKLSLPRIRLAQAASAFLLLAALTEIPQFWIPGRQPRVSDAVLDVAGGLGGYLPGTLLSWLWRGALSRIGAGRKS